MRAVALIPAYNAAGSIGETIAALKKLPDIDAVVVVDDGSTDGTAEAARSAGAEVVSHQANRGKGAALNTGLAHLAAKDYSVLALADSDLGNSAAEFGKLLAPVIRGEAEMTIAGFPPARRRGGFGLAKGFCRLGLRLYTGLWFASPMSGQRVLSSGILAHLPSFAPGWGCEPALTIDVHRAGGRILEVPVAMDHAETGRDIRSFAHRGRQLLAAALVFADRAVRRRAPGGDGD